MSSSKDHYDAVSEGYGKQYDNKNLYDTSAVYPANYFRLQILLNSFVQKNVKRVIEVGVGEGTPLMTLSKAGIDVHGFDISENMVEQAKKSAAKAGITENNIFLGDIQDPNTYIHAVKDGQFDGLMAMGVMPHVENDDMVLHNMSSLVKKGGTVFIEFRNTLFSLFSLNRYTSDFIVNDLLSGVDVRLRDLVSEELEDRLRTDQPPLRDKLDDGSPGYDAILSKFHNPLLIESFFKKHGFTDIKLHWYHYHPTMPYLSGIDKELFRSEAIKMEHESSGWKGYFLCSAFVVEATKL